MVLDNVLIPWEDVFFYRHTKAAQYIRGTLHRYSAFPYTLRVLYVADMMIGAALWNAKQTGLDKLQAVREKLADLVCYREGINAHLTASIALAQKSPGGLLMPHQSMLYAGRILACANLPQMMHIARELCGGQICVTPNEAAFTSEGSEQLAGEVLQPERQLAGRGPPQAARLRARPAQLGLCRPPADLRAVRAGAALQSSRRGLQQLRFLRPARLRQARRGPVGPRRREGEMMVEADRFREAMRRMASGVSVVTTDGPAGRFGVTVSSMCSLSMEPPSVIACVHHLSPAFDAIVKNGVFCANVLAAEQSCVSDSFAGRLLELKDDKFACAQWDDAADRQPGAQGRADRVRLPAEPRRRVRLAPHPDGHGGRAARARRPAR